MAAPLRPARREPRGGARGGGGRAASSCAGFTPAELRDLVAEAMEPVLRPLVLRRAAPPRRAAPRARRAASTSSRRRCRRSSRRSPTTSASTARSGRCARCATARTRASALRALHAENKARVRARARGAQRLRPRRVHRVLGQPHRPAVPRGGRQAGRRSTPTASCAGSPASAAGRCSSSARSAYPHARRRVPPVVWAAPARRSARGARRRGGDVDAEEALARLRARGFSEEDAQRLFAHFAEAEARGKLGPRLLARRVARDARGRSRRAAADDRGGGLVRALARPRRARLPRARRASCARSSPIRPSARGSSCASETFPTGMLGGWVRRLAEGGLVAVLTATSPPRLGPSRRPEARGHEPARDRHPELGRRPGRRRRVDGSGHVGRRHRRPALARRSSSRSAASSAHKALALALGLQLFVDALRREPGYGAVLLVAQPESDPVPGLRERAAGFRLPGDS